MLQIYRNNVPSTTIPLTREMNFQSALMGEYKITLDGLRTPAVLDVQIADSLLYKGVRFKVNTVPNYSKVEHTTQHEYNLSFEHPIYGLYDKILMFEGDTEVPGFGIPEWYVDLILDNINSIDAGWTKGQVDVADEQHIQFSEVSCRVALTTIAEKFKMEFYFDGDGKRLNLVAKVGQDRDITLEYGKGKGLYTLSRNYVEDKNVVTRVYGVGGSRNLPLGYTKSSLQLASPLEANIDLYGIKEGVYKNEDIFPTRTGTVSSVSPYDPESNFNQLVDLDLDFDINDYKAKGLTPKIGFQNGELAGEEFEITEYDHATKTITYLTNRDTSTGIVRPDANFQAKAGDKYKLFDIYLPQSYVDAALAKLEAEAQAYLEESKFPRVAYDLSIDVLHFKRNGYEINPGDRIRIIDKDIHLDTNIRVTSVSYPLAFYEEGSIWNSMQYSVELANDFIPYTVQERLQIEQREQKKAIREQSKVSKHTQAALDEIARAAAINQFERTYVGQLAILTGALIVGNPELGANAFISGLGDSLDDIRLGAGSSIEDRNTAPWRVNQRGQMWATDAFIKGVIEAISGKIGNWVIDSNGLINDDGNAYMIARKFFRDVSNAIIGEASAMFGANVLSATTGLRAVGKLENSEPNELNTNYGLLISVLNASINTAIKATGSIFNQGFNGSYNIYQFTPLSGGAGNIIHPKYGTHVSCYITNAASSTVYLPTDSYVQQLLGIGDTQDYCIQITVTNQFNSTENMVLAVDSIGGWTIKYRDGGASFSVGSMTIGPSGSATFNITKSGTTKWAQVID